MKCKMKMNHRDREKLALLSNGYRIHEPSIRNALHCFDESIIKLDCVDPDKFKGMNRPPAGFNFDSFINILQQCDRIVIQSMFLKNWNTTPTDLNRWMKALEKIRPVSVQIYTLSRERALRGLDPLSEQELFRIAEEASRQLKISVQAYF